MALPICGPIRLTPPGRLQWVMFALSGSDRVKGGGVTGAVWGNRTHPSPVWKTGAQPICQDRVNWRVRQGLIPACLIICLIWRDSRSPGQTHTRYVPHTSFRAARVIINAKAPRSLTERFKLPGYPREWYRERTRPLGPLETILLAPVSPTCQIHAPLP